MSPRLPFKFIRLLGVVVISALLMTACSVRPALFDRKELSERCLKCQFPGNEWIAYPAGQLLPGYTLKREKELSEDPSRGIGLKQANSMGGGEAQIPPMSKFRVFVFMGQSNMVGHAKAGKLEPPLNEPHPRIRIWARGKWQYLVPKRNFGPEVTFAHRAAAFFPGDTIGIIKVAVSGTGMNAWKPDWEWSEASKTGDALKGSLYRDMIEAVSAAKSSFDFQLSGFVWKQGGRDARKSELADSYQDRFIELVTHLRNDLGAPELPVFVLTYFDEAGIEANRELLEKVRPKAFPLYLSKARVSQYIENAYPIFHGRLPTGIDQIHFNTEGQLRLGEITADAIREYYTIQEPVIGASPAMNEGKIVSPPIP